MVLAVWRILYTHTHKPDSPSPAILSDCTTENISTELLANSLVVAITRKHFRLQAFTGKDTYTVYVCHVLSTNLESDFGWQKVFTSTLATNADKQREKNKLLPEIMLHDIVIQFHLLCQISISLVYFRVEAV